MLGKMDWLYTSTFMFLWERFPTVLEKNGEKIYIPIVFCMALPHRHSGTMGRHIFMEMHSYFYTYLDKQLVWIDQKDLVRAHVVRYEMRQSRLIVKLRLFKTLFPCNVLGGSCLKSSQVPYKSLTFFPLLIFHYDRK